ncbi:uncharacterized protein LOC144906961 isoform X2 [Branchiostoma floridae x Branchiostoma belcheri]
MTCYLMRQCKTRAYAALQITCLVISLQVTSTKSSDQDKTFSDLKRERNQQTCICRRIDISSFLLETSGRPRGQVYRKQNRATQYFTLLRIYLAEEPSKSIQSPLRIPRPESH